MSLKRGVSSARMAQVGMWNTPGCKFFARIQAAARRSTPLSWTLQDRPRARAPSTTFESSPTHNLESHGDVPQELPKGLCLQDVDVPAVEAPLGQRLPRHPLREVNCPGVGDVSPPHLRGRMGGECLG